MKLRLNRKRMQAVADSPSAAAALRQALKAARENPAQAYKALRPRDRNAIGYLGPAFSTKVLYLAGHGAHLLHDRRRSGRPAGHVHPSRRPRHPVPHLRGTAGVRRRAS
jgi:hypothetical protein